VIWLQIVFVISQPISVWLKFSVTIRYMRGFREQLGFARRCCCLYWFHHFFPHAIAVSKLRMLNELSFATHMLRLEEETSKFWLF
jgi:hypothetical protein